MKTLLLLRHAKSSWKDSDIEDHERPLNKRGKKDAPKMGQLLSSENLLPDLIIASTAKRCRKTTEHVIHASGYRGETHFCNELYEAGSSTLLACLAKQSAEVVRLLMIGHNPGLEELLESLTTTYTPLTTAALAYLELPIEAWSEISDTTEAALIKVWQPRELED